MNIGIDFRLANASNRGMGRYCREITFELLRLDKNNTYYLYIDCALSYPILSEYDNCRIQVISTSNYIIGEQFFLPYYAKKHKLNILWCPSNTFPLILRKDTLLFSTIHDLIFMKQKHNPNFHQNIGRLYRKYCLLLGHKRIKRCFSVSEFSCNEIKSEFDITEVYLTYNCADRFYKTVKLQGPKKVGSEDSPFYFTLSGDAPSKNLTYLIDIFNEKFPNEILFIAGVSSSSSLRNKATKNIRFLPSGISDEALIYYYNSCKAFLFLSLEEGFGLPIIEALMCNAKIIASNRTSIPEILGNCGLLIDPQNPSELLVALKDINEFKLDEKTKELQLSKFLHWKDSASVLFHHINASSHI